MPGELTALACLSLFLMLAWFPSSIAKYRLYGWSYLASNRGRKDLPPLAGWGGRVERAHSNLKDYFPSFAVAILILALQHKFDSLTLSCAWIFVVARFLHFISYGLGSVPLRALFWLMAMISNLVLFQKILF